MVSLIRGIIGIVVAVAGIIILILGLVDLIGFAWVSAIIKIIVGAVLIYLGYDVIGWPTKSATI